MSSSTMAGALCLLARRGAIHKEVGLVKTKRSSGVCRIVSPSVGDFVRHEGGKELPRKKRNVGIVVNPSYFYR